MVRSGFFLASLFGLIRGDGETSRDIQLSVKHDQFYYSDKGTVLVSYDFPDDNAFIDVKTLYFQLPELFKPAVSTDICRSVIVNGNKITSDEKTIVTCSPFDHNGRIALDVKMKDGSSFPRTPTTIEVSIKTPSEEEDKAIKDASHLWVVEVVFPDHHFLTYSVRDSALNTSPKTDCVYAEPEDKTVCSANCGGGYKLVERAPLFGDPQNCPLVSYWEMCNAFACEVDCALEKSWRPIVECTIDCDATDDNSYQILARRVSVPASNGGLPCKKIYPEFDEVLKMGIKKAKCPEKYRQPCQRSQLRHEKLPYIGDDLDFTTGSDKLTNKELFMDLTKLRNHKFDVTVDDINMGCAPEPSQWLVMGQNDPSYQKPWGGLCSMPCGPDGRVNKIRSLSKGVPFGSKCPADHPQARENGFLPESCNSRQCQPLEVYLKETTPNMNTYAHLFFSPMYSPFREIFIHAPPGYEFGRFTMSPCSPGVVRQHTFGEQEKVVSCEIGDTKNKLILRLASPSPRAPASALHRRKGSEDLIKKYVVPHQLTVVVSLPNQESTELDERGRWIVDIRGGPDNNQEEVFNFNGEPLNQIVRDERARYEDLLERGDLELSNDGSTRVVCPNTPLPTPTACILNCIEKNQIVSSTKSFSIKPEKIDALGNPCVKKSSQLYELDNVTVTCGECSRRILEESLKREAMSPHMAVVSSTSVVTPGDDDLEDGGTSAIVEIVRKKLEKQPDGSYISTETREAVDQKLANKILKKTDNKKETFINLVEVSAEANLNALQQPPSGRGFLSTEEESIIPY